MTLAKRKKMRLEGYDYSQNGAYFITICTRNHEMLFGDVGADSISARMIADIFEKTVSQYAGVSCLKYVIMPNHFHAILVMEKGDMESMREDMESMREDMESSPTATATTVGEVVQSFKRHSTIAYIRLVKERVLPPFEKQIWQRSYYDHIIRNEQDYLNIWEYIDTNPAKWAEDRFYPHE